MLTQHLTRCLTRANPAAVLPSSLVFLRPRLPTRMATCPASTNTTTGSDKVDPFGHPGQADGYARFRPRYPPELLDKLIKTAEARGLGGEAGSVKKGILVDVCTGTGVLLSQIARHFDRAVGLDRSAAQLSAAVPGPNIEYKQADAYQLPLDSKSADIITIAQGIHWLDIPRFGTECDRLLKDDGLLVALGYAYSIVDNEAAQHHFLRWYETLEPYWECDRHLLDTALRGADYGPHMKEVMRHEVVEVRELSMDEYFGYLRTWSAYNTWRAANPHELDSLVRLREELVKVLGGGPQVVVKVRTPFFAVYVEKSK